MCVGDDALMMSSHCEMMLHHDDLRLNGACRAWHVIGMFCKNLQKNASCGPQRYMFGSPDSPGRPLDVTHIPLSDDKHQMV